MLAELKERSQVTIPKSVVVELGLQTGDQFDVVIHEGEIHLVPVVVYPKSKINELEKMAAQAEALIASGSGHLFDTADDAITSLHKGS
jgi:AbrB family looped-hinge helix DNA binding protein